MKKERNKMRDTMKNILRMTGKINMKIERDHTEKEVERRIQDIENIAMKEAIINPEGIIEITIETKEILWIKDIVIKIEIGEIKEIKGNTEIELCTEVIGIIIGIDQEIISHIQKEMKNIMMIKKMIQETGNLIHITMIASKMILKEKIVVIANSRS